MTRKIHFHLSFDNCSFPFVKTEKSNSFSFDYDGRVICHISDMTRFFCLRIHNETLLNSFFPSCSVTMNSNDEQ